MDFMQILAAVSPAALVVAVVGVIRKVAHLNTDVAPVVAMGAGVAVLGLIGYATGKITDGNMLAAVVIDGVVAGLTACGLYDVGKRTLGLGPDDAGTTE